MKITIESQGFEEREDKVRAMAMMYGMEAFYALSDFRDYLRNIIKYGDEKISEEVAYILLERFNSCLDGERISGIFYENFF